MEYSIFTQLGDTLDSTRPTPNRALRAQVGNAPPHTIDIALESVIIYPATWRWDGKRVLVSGTFEGWPEPGGLASILRQHGAILLDRLNPTLDVFIMGPDADPSDLADLHGLLRAGSKVLLFQEATLRGLLDL